MTAARLRRRAVLAALSGAVLIAALVFLVQMGAQVRQQIDSVATANSDSTQWSLAQVDVELLALKAALLEAELDPAADLGEVRQRFDVLYSRVRTLANSPLYRALRDEPEARDALGQIDAYLSDAVPLIDSSDAVLRRALPQLVGQTAAIRPIVRKVTLEGVTVLARAADAQRRGIAETLSLVSVLSAGLLLSLLVVLGLLLHYARRARHRALEESLVRARLASIISTSLDAVLVVGQDGRIIDFNGAAETVFGYSRSEAVGALMQDLIIPDHLKAAHEAGMNRYLETGQRRVIGKGRVKLDARRKNGDIFPAELSISTAESEAGKVFVSFARDISHRVAAEQALIEARDEAVAGERAKADLIAVMSHEMRTPLNGLLGTLELIDPKTRGPKDAAYLQIIRASGQHLLHHVDTVLEVSRAEAGKIDFARETFSITALVRELVESQRSVAEHRGNVLSYKVDAKDQDYAVGDPARTRQVLLNLIGNAIKFTRNGSITVEAERLAEPGLVEFRVRDTGIGISEADRDRIFDEFVTLDTSYSRAVGGTGLGLAIVKRLALAMGGAVGLDSAQGQGSTFRVRLPLPVPDEDSGDAHFREAGQSGQAQPAAIAPRRILIVEDNRINRIVLRDLLEQDGHEVDEAHDGEQGVGFVQRKTYDFVFMDISMPVLDGVEATRAIRASEARGTRLPIVALTAHALQADKERFRAAGLDDILVKPISRDGVRAVLAAYLGSGPAPAPPPISAPSPDEVQPLDRDHLAALADSLGPEKTAGLVSAFLAELGAAVEAIAYRFETGETVGTLREDVHHAAGSAALLGAERLRRDLVRLEELLAAGAHGRADDATRLRATWADTAPALEAFQADG